MASDLGTPKPPGEGESCCPRGQCGRDSGGRLRGVCGEGRGRARHGDTALAEAVAGDTVVVTGIFGDEAFRGRIMAMGLLPGVVLTVVGGGGRQPLLVALPGSRCVVDKHSAEMIAVRAARPQCRRGRTHS